MSRHNKYKIGTVKLTVTVENEDKFKLYRKATTQDYPDASSLLREIIHEAVWDTPLTKSDYAALAALRKKQERV